MEFFSKPNKAKLKIIMTSDLSKQPNIGKDTESKLILVDISSFAEIKAAGTEHAFLRLQTLDPEACIQLL